ncbi:CYTH domain-containing protein [Saccharibacillus sp. CPCC 101409]|uniref:CYTH domain-containing protein n=1 Tax=Saccharibacillus sp. CPCC 101409 TaxID=3058041 RepID=UPI0026710248|nr:CYTH domain-containing protein [Saccharibacillus sp. CPCC 101409]MDO3408178.1 CYTH domain-containing protein [Saccharibacillus sp. CPCC 101409]
MGMEIERKFLLEAAPEELIARGAFVRRSEQRIEQTYLALDEGQEVRVRRLTDADTGEVEYTHTFKRGNGLSREEIEYSISASIYEQLFTASGAVPLTKTRTTGEWNGVTVELDRYDQLNLTVAEVEFDSVEAAQAFTPPDWFGEDISSKREYSNKKVWKDLQNRS